MARRSGFGTSSRCLAVAAMTALLASCGGGADADASGDAGGEDAASAPATPAGGEVARRDFVLCPAIEGIAEDLAALADFQIDATRGVEAMAGECHVRGQDAAFVQVILAPAIVPSVAMQASGYDTPAVAAPELGEQAVVVEDPVQPRAIFRVRGQIIDVGIENSGHPPDAATIRQAGSMVRDALEKANGG